MNLHACHELDRERQLVSAENSAVSDLLGAGALDGTENTVPLAERRNFHHFHLASA